MERGWMLLSKEQIPNNINIPKNGRLLLAFSGGSDSLSLMIALSILAPDRTKAVYVDHALRERKELDEEIELNKKNAKILAIELDIIKIPSGAIEEYARMKRCGIEAAARSLRYKELEKYRVDNGFDYILTAHHREDQVETVLMRILQNAPFYSFQGILGDDGVIKRPLLDVSKSQINSLIADSGLVFSVDSTNKDTKYRRNDIRRNILPYIGEEERISICKIARNISQYRSQIDKIEIKMETHYVSILRDSFSRSSLISKENAIFRASSYLENPERLSRSFLSELYDKIEKGHGKLNTAHLVFIVGKNEIRIYKNKDFFYSYYSNGLDSIDEFRIEHNNFDFKDLLIDISLFSGQCLIRKSKPGDVILLKEGTKKVSELERRALAPYSIVLEDENGIIAVFLRFFGANDRLSRRFLDRKGIPFKLS